MIEFYNSAVGYFSKEFKLPKKGFPKLKIVPGEIGEYDSIKNTVKIGEERLIERIGNTIGEELGHYVRAKLTGRMGRGWNIEEIYTSEFYGFLGRKILFRLANKKERWPFFQDRDMIDFGADHRSKVYSERRDIIINTSKERGFPKLKKRYMEAMISGDEEEIQKVNKKLEEGGWEEHISNLIHTRPYNFASGMDLTKVGDLREFYSLPDKTVRKRFFRENKMYDDEEGAKEGTKKETRLESKIAEL